MSLAVTAEASKELRGCKSQQKAGEAEEVVEKIKRRVEEGEKEKIRKNIGNNRMKRWNRRGKKGGKKS